MNLIVIDNGIGFDTTKLEKFKGIGLKSIESRVDALGGEISIDSGKGSGTTITVDIII